MRAFMCRGGFDAGGLECLGAGEGGCLEGGIDVRL